MQIAFNFKIIVYFQISLIYGALLVAAIVVILMVSVSFTGFITSVV